MHTYKYYHNSKSINIKSLHGEEGNLDWPTTAKFPSNWLDIIRSFSNLYNKGVDLLSSIKKKVGNGENTMFWDELWKGEVLFKNLFPRLYALESVKNISVADKMAQPSLEYSFRRNIRGGAEQVQMASLLSLLEGLILPNMIDRWMWSISGDGEFSVSSGFVWIDSEVEKTESDTLSSLPISTTTPPHKSVFVGDPKMTDFKQFLAGKGIQIICCAFALQSN
nr:RNA-directed DNA polymerase, eukaryota, reverse transcriptase zinc-binding domain protein [Tanacetum cinerariifolium]GEY60482.1 RNA-directed DNA polymerase, eukaryota, reverse transcriptase zinc-binding domain protein [Tanacetum cinerariifolium]